MAIADWLAPNAPTDKDRLRQDLLELEQRVNDIEDATRGLRFENGVPEDTAGRDGWTVVDAETGSVYRKAAGSWSKIGEMWWQPADGA